MKTRSNRIKIAVVLAAGFVLAWLCSWSAAASDMDSGADGTTPGFYLSGDAGVAILQNITTSGTLQQFTVGPKVDVSVGYNITHNIAAEIQGGFAHNYYSKVGGQPLPPGDSADIWTVPVMANGIYKYSFNKHWQAYGGLGVGVVISQIGLKVPPSDGSFTYSPGCTFGYQAMLGIKYRFNDHLECGLGYTFLGSLDQSYSSAFTFPAKNEITYSTSPIYIHSILVSLSYKF